MSDWSLSHQAELVQHKSDLSAAKHEKGRLQASVAEQSQRIREEALEKQQVTTQLELQRMQLLTLTSEFSVSHHKVGCKYSFYEVTCLLL